MRIVFTLMPNNGTVATIYRPDGVVVDLPSFSRTHRVPHDLAHAVAERELRLAGGIYGSLAAGALFSNARIVSGRVRHDAAQRSERILRANRADLGLSELLAGALHEAVEHDRRSEVLAIVRRNWNIVNVGPLPYEEADVSRAASTLHTLSLSWDLLARHESMDFHWPDSLVSPVPRPPRQRRVATRLRTRA